MNEVHDEPKARGWFKLFKRIDGDGSGRIQFDELVGMVRVHIRKAHSARGEGRVLAPL